MGKIIEACLDISQAILHWRSFRPALVCGKVGDSGRRSVKVEVEVKFKVIEILPGQNSIGPNIMG